MADIQILDEDDSKEVLRKLLKSNNFKFESFKILNFHNPLQGLIGEHFILRIDYAYEDEEREEDFFVKTLSTNPFMVKMSKCLRIHEKEEFFYKILEDYESRGIDTSFAPRGLFFKPGVVVLEDLSKKYRGTPKRKYLDFGHCCACLETLAKFHASTIIYEKQRQLSLSEENPEILEDKTASKDEDNLVRQWMVSSVGGLLDLIDLIPENHITNQDFKTRLLELLSVEDTPPGSVSAILHGDLWTGNFLYLYEEGTPIEAKLLDFQLVKYGPVESDLVEFLMTNTSRSFRAAHYETLIEHYYTKLKECLIGASLTSEVLPEKSEFVLSCDNFKLAGKVRAMVDHSYTFLADEIYEAALQSEESYRKFLFEERGKCIIESYNKNEEFKNVLYEDALELRDLLFA